MTPSWPPLLEEHISLLGVHGVRVNGKGEGKGGIDGGRGEEWIKKGEYGERLKEWLTHCSDGCFACHTT